MTRYLLPLGLFVIVGIFLGISLNRDPHDIGVTAVGKKIPVFLLVQVLDSNKTLSDKDLLGKVSLFNAWASWCTTCRLEHPLLMQLAKEMNVPIYGLNYLDNLSEAKTLLAQTGNPYLASGFDERGQVGIAWGLTGTPETFVVDKKGIIRYKQIGNLTPDVLDKEILPLIEKLRLEP